MKSVCVYCGKIHDKSFNCGKKPVNRFRSKGTNADKFRWTYAWKDKREQIKYRDKCLCRYCLYKNKITCDDLSVHHIEPIKERHDLRLEDTNLITLCSSCHSLAEDGKINRTLLHELAEHPPGIEF